MTSDTAPGRATRLAGLTRAEAERRLAEGAPREPPATSRSYGSIVRANLFTVFNLILLFFGGLTLLFGDWRDALFLGILIANSGIGIAQEARAKRELDRLAALVAPGATVVRDGAPERLPIDRVVVGDLVRLEAGDQVVADGRLESSEGLMLDESILTGESRPVARAAGEEVRAGSFAVEGAGLYTVTAVGADSLAGRIAGEARQFRHPRSPLERAMNRLLLVLVGIMVPLGSLLGYALWKRADPLEETISTSVAAVVTLVPEGLILLTSLTYAVAALRMSRRGALTQQLNAVESLASADVVCLDKTGTLTEAASRVVGVVPAPGVGADELTSALARYAASSPVRNATVAALAEAFPAPAEEPAASVPFSSRRRWSGLELAGERYVLGAPELFPLGELAAAAEREAAGGRRVLALGLSEAPLPAEPADAPPPGPLRTLGLVVLGERLRPRAAETVEFLRAQGVALKVLSGDAPATVAAIAADTGIPLDGQPLDGSRLPEDPAALRELVLSASVVGRISPEGKRRVVEALRNAGKYVAMVGDGVNDVPALKAARLAIAQGTGSDMAKSVSDVVLVAGDFGSVPAMIAEGRRLLRNLQRVTKLYVTKSALAAVLILSIGITPTAYPFLPRHLTLAAALTIGIPSFLIALAPSAGGWSIRGFLRDVSSFAVPAGTAAALGVLSSYLFCVEVAALTVEEGRTVAVTVLVLVGLYLVLPLEVAGWRRGGAVGALVLALLALYALVLAFPAAREFFALVAPTPLMVVASVVGASLSIAGLVLTDARFVPGRSDAAPRG
jgi:P-type E1-E2 ATPase